MKPGTVFACFLPVSAKVKILDRSGSKGYVIRQSLFEKNVRCTSQCNTRHVRKKPVKVKDKKKYSS